MYKDAYHGDDVNGMCCIHLLVNQAVIMRNVIDMCERQHTKIRIYTGPHDYLKLSQITKTYSDLFQALDVTFSLLHTYLQQI